MNFLLQKLVNMIKRGLVTLPGSDADPYCRTQVSYMGKTKNIEVVFPYGLAANLPENALVLLFNVQGQEENMAGIGNTPTQRFKNLAPGEVVVGSPRFGNYVKFGASGVIEIASTGALNVTVPGSANLTVAGETKLMGTGKITIDGSGEVLIKGASAINLGEGGAAVARVGDSVQVDPGTHVGTILTGSTKVKSI